ncbi:hypothetical protein FQZ97_782880 [compost metagenome]
MLRIGHHAGAVVVQVGLHGHGRAVVQDQDVTHQGIEVDGGELRRGQSRVVAEFVDQVLHGVDLIDDGADRFVQQGLLGRLELALQLHGQALCRQLDRRERVLDLVRQAPGHLPPGPGTLGGHHFRHIVEHQQALVVGQQRAACDQGDALVVAGIAVGAEFERLLPVAAFVRGVVGQEAVELLQHLRRKILQTDHGRQRLTQVQPQRSAQNAGRSGIDTEHAPAFVEHDHPGREVVQDGLQVFPGSVHLLHAVLHRRARIGQVLCHVGEGASQTRKLVTRGQFHFGREVALGDLAHAFREHEQRTHQMVAQQHGQQHGAEDGQKEGQRERADVHALQPLASERALLVFAVGHLDGQGIGDQRTRQGHHDLKVTRVFIESESGGLHEGQHLDVRLCHRQAGLHRLFPHLFKPLDQHHHPVRAHAAQLGHGRAVG